VHSFKNQGTWVANSPQVRPQLQGNVSKEQCSLEILYTYNTSVLDGLKTFDPSNKDRAPKEALRNWSKKLPCTLSGLVWSGLLRRQWSRLVLSGPV
jgi:hypothetical protein